MTPRQRMEMALRFEEPDRPPHFEQVFELVEEAFGLSFPLENELNMASDKEKDRIFNNYCEIYGKIIERFQWDALIIFNPSPVGENILEFIPYLKKYLGPDIPVGTFIWDSAIAIDTIKDYMQLAIDLHEDRAALHKTAENMLRVALERARRLVACGSDIIDVATDFAFNAGPMLSPKDFAEFTTPYMKELVSYIRKQGVKVICHSDGNLMPVLDQMIEINPHVLQSIDPMAGMDIAKVKKLTYKKIALMGNVQCSLLQDGPKEKIIESAEYAIQHGSPGGGFIYSSSNTIFRGLPLENYEIMVDYFHQRFEYAQN